MMPKKKGKQKPPNTMSSDQSPTSQTPIPEPRAPSSASPKIERWENAKEEGNTHFSQKSYELARISYTTAIALLEKTISHDNTASSREDKGTLAKLYGNRAAAHFQLALTYEKKDQEEFERLLQLCVDNCEVALVYDPKYEKAHFRCALAEHKLGSRPEKTVKHLDKILALYKSIGKDYSNDQAMIKLLQDCSYLSVKKVTSANWGKVKFKNNCRILDPYGAGDHTSLSGDIFASGKKVSLLVRPGLYKLVNITVIAPNYELDIVGDINGKDDEITFLCTGCVPIFGLKEGKLSIRQINLRQTVQHPDMHAIHTTDKCEVEMTDCKCYARSSGVIALAGNSKLTMRGCAVENACCGVIMAGISQAYISGCSFDRLVRIGVEVRNGAFATVTKSQFTHCGLQAITCHAGGKGYIAEDCMFYGNMTQQGDQQTALSVAAGHCVISNCQLINNKGGGVMVQEGGTATIKGCTITGGRTGVGFSVHGEGTVQDCKLLNVQVAFAILYNQGGCVTLKNNTLKKSYREVLICSGDLIPNMIGNRHKVYTNPEMGKRDILRQQRLLKADRYQPEKCLDDPRTYTIESARHCNPCGVSQRRADTPFLACGGCMMYWYCSKQCQKKEWPLHKQYCKMIQKTLRKN